MRLVILDRYEKVSEWTARYIKKRIHDFNPGPGRFFTLGLPTGQFLSLLNLASKTCCKSLFVFAFHMKFVNRLTAGISTSHNKLFVCLLVPFYILISSISIAFCSQPEVASSVISVRSMWLSIAHKCVQFCDPRINWSEEI